MQTIMKSSAFDKATIFSLPSQIKSVVIPYNDVSDMPWYYDLHHGTKYLLYSSTFIHQHMCTLQYNNKNTNNNHPPQKKP